ncbi:hypothetical protein T4B_1958 [Trichinella pseudospiralis]|uniref:Uncharacterized protein n=1 Tax=Trichinella pseudospiralis TaxID=6337 RepID=A0A0V1IU44_TRIPS|nr:hypothetical protein T4B_1958 [Trichinella pseudospiralis]
MEKLFNPAIVLLIILCTSCAFNQNAKAELVNSTTSDITMRWLNCNRVDISSSKLRNKIIFIVKIKTGKIGYRNLIFKRLKRKQKLIAEIYY